MPTFLHTTSPRLVSAGNHTYLIDLFHQGEPRTIGAYLLLDDKPALIEVGPATTLEHLLAGIRETGLEPDDLHYVFLTHIHLDHAGATGALLERYPHLQVFVHPLGAPHLVDPSKLWRSARRVFGERLDTFFGEPMPVPENRVRTLQDGEEVSLGQRRLKAVDTPGHAAHHFAFWEEERQWLFAGDVAGCDVPDGFYNHPPTPAPEFDLDTWRASIARLRELEADRLFYTHFGWTDSPDLESLQDELEHRAQLVKAWLDEGQSDEAVIARFNEEIDERLASRVGPALVRRYLLLGDAVTNAPGLIRYWRKKEAGV